MSRLARPTRMRRTTRSPSWRPRSIAALAFPAVVLSCGLASTKSAICARRVCAAVFSCMPRASAYWKSTSSSTCMSIIWSHSCRVGGRPVSATKSFSIASRRCAGISTRRFCGSQAPPRSSKAPKSRAPSAAMCSAGAFHHLIASLLGDGRARRRLVPDRRGPGALLDHRLQEGAGRLVGAAHGALARLELVFLAGAPKRRELAVALAGVQRVDTDPLAAPQRAVAADRLLQHGPLGEGVLPGVEERVLPHRAELLIAEVFLRLAGRRVDRRLRVERAARVAGDGVDALVLVALPVDPALDDLDLLPLGLDLVVPGRPGDEGRRALAGLE